MVATVDSAGTNVTVSDNDLAVAEHKALHGDWVPTVPMTVDGVEYPRFSLDGGWVGVLVGDMNTGFHLAAADEERLAERIRHEVRRTTPHIDVAAWQAAKHLADAKARATK
jgi:hypothetical protein